MNERIQELLIEAHRQTKGGIYTGHISDWTEKFAELIVRECIDIISPYAVKMENFDGGHPIADLKKHFGVEE